MQRFKNLKKTGLTVALSIVSCFGCTTVATAQTNPHTAVTPPCASQIRTQ